MLLTFLIDPPFVLLLGFLFAFALPTTSTAPIKYSRALKAGLITVTLFNLAVAISYLWFPDWMWMYHFAASQWSASLFYASLALGLCAYYLFFAMGFFWGLQRRDSPRAWRIGAGLLLLSGLVIVPVFDQYFHVGTITDYAAGTAMPLPQSPLALVYNITLPLMLLLGALLFAWARKEKPLPR